MFEIHPINETSPKHLRALRQDRCKHVIDHVSGGVHKYGARCTRFATYLVNGERLCTQHAGKACLIYQLKQIEA